MSGQFATTAAAAHIYPDLVPLSFLQREMLWPFVQCVVVVVGKRNSVNSCTAFYSVPNVLELPFVLRRLYSSSSTFSCFSPSDIGKRFGSNVPDDIFILKKNRSFSFLQTRPEEKT